MNLDNYDVKLEFLKEHPTYKDLEWEVIKTPVNFNGHVYTKVCYQKPKGIIWRVVNGIGAFLLTITIIPLIIDLKSVKVFWKRAITGLEQKTMLVVQKLIKPKHIDNKKRPKETPAAISAELMPEEFLNPGVVVEYQHTDPHFINIMRSIVSEHFKFKYPDKEPTNKQLDAIIEGIREAAQQIKKGYLLIYEVEQGKILVLIQSDGKQYICKTNFKQPMHEFYIGLSNLIKKLESEGKDISNNDEYFNYLNPISKPFKEYVKENINLVNSPKIFEKLSHFEKNKPDEPDKSQIDDILVKVF